MSGFRVTMERLVIYPHPNADSLELAQVGEYRAVVRRDVYETGDYAIYIPEQAILPGDLIEDLGLSGMLAGGYGNRVKAVRLRGELSQGIVCRPPSMSWLWERDRDDQEAYAANCVEFGTDFAGELGIVKWVPPVPTQLDGKVTPAPNLIRWCDIENIKRSPDMFDEGEPVVATEKIHGTCCLLTVTESGEVLVSSKGYGGRSLSLVEEPGNLYWRAVRRFGLVEYAQALLEVLRVPAVGLFGEVFGRGIQDLHYGSEAAVDDAIGYALFDVATAGPLGMSYLPPATVARTMLDLPLPPPPLAPVLYDGPYHYETLRDLAEGREEVSGQSLHIREGLVVRRKLSEARTAEGARRIAKFVSEAYLLRKDGTEYE